jgi:hypothetical protein
MLILSNVLVFYKSILIAKIWHIDINTRARIKAVINKVESLNIIILTINNAINIKVV